MWRTTVPRLNQNEQLWQRLDQYFDVLQRSQLAEKSVEDYYYFAECFVRWVNGEFTPGQNIRNEVEVLNTPIERRVDGKR
jgi:hypothetical protein